MRRTVAPIRKRGNGQGSRPTYVAARNTWKASVYIDGKRKYVYGATSDAVAKKQVDLLKARNDGTPLYDGHQTVQQFFESWRAIEQYHGKGVGESTMIQHEILLRRHVYPTIGKVPLTKLTPQHLDTLYTTLLKSGLSKGTVRCTHQVIHKGLSYAVYPSRLIPNNIADAGFVSPPAKSNRSSRRAPTNEELATLREGIAGERIEPPILLALATGARKGEVLSLRWSDLDLDAGTVQWTRSLRHKTGTGIVFGPVKTHRSEREVPVANIAVAALRRWKVQQTAERLRAGTAWHDLGLVFTTLEGRPLAPTNFSRTWNELVAKLGLPHHTFHGFTRHGFATQMLAGGVPMKIVSDMLGHASIAITADIYSHVSTETMRPAAAQMDAILAGGRA